MEMAKKIANQNGSTTYGQSLTIFLVAMSEFLTITLVQKLKLGALNWKIRKIVKAGISFVTKA